MAVQPGLCVSTSPAGKSHARSGVRTFIHLSVRKAFVLFHLNNSVEERGWGRRGKVPPTLTPVKAALGCRLGLPVFSQPCLYLPSSVGHMQDTDGSGFS